MSGTNALWTISPAEMKAAIDAHFAKLAESPLGMDSVWESKPAGGKPYLSGGRRGTIAYGTIGSWDELALLAMLVNCWPAISAHLQAQAETIARLEAGPAPVSVDEPDAGTQQQRARDLMDRALGAFRSGGTLRDDRGERS